MSVKLPKDTAGRDLDSQGPGSVCDFFSHSKSAFTFTPKYMVCFSFLSERIPQWSELQASQTLGPLLLVSLESSPTGDGGLGAGAGVPPETGSFQKVGCDVSEKEPGSCSLGACSV